MLNFLQTINSIENTNTANRLAPVLGTALYALALFSLLTREQFVRHYSKLQRNICGIHADCYSTVITHNIASTMLNIKCNNYSIDFPTKYNIIVFLLPS